MTERPKIYSHDSMAILLLSYIAMNPWLYKHGNIAIGYIAMDSWQYSQQLDTPK